MQELVFFLSVFLVKVEATLGTENEAGNGSFEKALLEKHIVNIQLTSAQYFFCFFLEQRKNPRDDFLTWLKG